MKKLGVLSLILIVGFALGFISSAFITPTPSFENPLSNFTNKERLSPSDIIKENQIKVYPDRVVIYVDNPQWAEYTNTNSMDPLFDENANGLEFVPKSPDEINIGDIAAYESKYGLIIHRVIDKKVEDGKTLFNFKGDNNLFNDGWIGFDKIKYVTWGVIY